MFIFNLNTTVFKEADMLTDKLGKWELLTMQEQGETKIHDPWERW